MKRSPESAQQPTEAQKSRKEEPYQERMQRITERELCDSHNAQPVLVESLVLAAELGPTTLSTNAESILSIESILSLTQFAKKKKWLCIWGPEYVDETHRVSNIFRPICLEQKYEKLDRESNYSEIDLPHEDFLALLSDPKQRWQRITLPEYHPIYFELLHLHPCEELRLFCSDEGPKMTRTDLENIAKCKTLRFFNMEFFKATPESMAALQKLPHLQNVIFNNIEDAYDCVEALMQVPQATTIQINTGSNNVYYDSHAYPFEDHELAGALSYITGRKNTAKEIYLYVTIGPIIMATLAQCTQVESISVLEVDPQGEDKHMYLMFMSPTLQRSVRHLRFGYSNMSSQSLFYLSKFTNLLSIEMDSMYVSTSELLPIIQANAAHLHTLILWECQYIDAKLLDIVAECKNLRVVDIGGTKITRAAIEKYKKAKRPNWYALNYTEAVPLWGSSARPSE